jgi:hypothetical protein
MGWDFSRVKFQLLIPYFTLTWLCDHYVGARICLDVSFLGILTSPLGPIFITVWTRIFVVFLTDENATLDSRKLRIRPELFNPKYYKLEPCCGRLAWLTNYMIVYFDICCRLDIACIAFVFIGFFIALLAIRFPRLLILTFNVVWFILSTLMLLFTYAYFL